MSLLTEKSQLQIDIEEQENSVVRVAQAVEYVAKLITQENAKFWGKSPERIEAVLNADVAKTLATFAQNTAVGTAINAILDGLEMPSLANRAPVAPGREITFDGTAFSVVVPPAPDPEPQPEEVP